MADKFKLLPDSPIAPARKMWPIAPGAAEIDPLPKALRADTPGVIVLQAVEGGVDVTINVVAGEIVPVRAAFVKAGTTATVHGLA